MVQMARQMALRTRLEFWANQLEIIISAYIYRRETLLRCNGIICEMFDYKGCTCHLSVSNIDGMTVKCLFTTMERGYTPVGCLVRVKVGDTAV